MKKIISLIVLFSFFLLPLLSPKNVEAQNVGSLRSVVSSGFSFRKDLRLGDTDPDVRELQRVLNADIDTMIISDGAGSRGEETTYFGALTKTAVMKFQNKYKDIVLTLNSITTADGIVNKATRTRLNLLIGVMNTYDSVGLPQGRAGTTPASYTPPAIIPAPTPTPQPSMSTCQFVELLINIGAIVPAKAGPARQAMNCVAGTSGTFVDLKANGQNGPVTVAKNSSITISWTSGGVISCSTGANNKPLSGSEVFTMGTTKQTFVLTCRTATGVSLSDSVLVNISGANGTAPILLSTGGYSFGYTIGVFNINTNVPTRAYITYWINSSDKKTASFTTLKSSRSEIISGLTPNTLYHFTIRIVDADGNDYTSSEYQGRTSSNPADDGSGTSTTTPEQPSPDLKQRVLYSADGAGFVSVTGSESLKTNDKVTLEAWVKPTSWSSTNGISKTMDQVIISKGDIGGNIDYALSLDNGKLVYSNNDASLWTCSPVVPLNVWTHVAVAVDEVTQSLDLFVNGTKVSSTTGTICEGKRGVFKKAETINRATAITNLPNSSIEQQAMGTPDYLNMTTEQIMASLASSFSSMSANPTSNVHIGNFYPRAEACSASIPKGNGFIGYIDDVRIWNTARTEAQIKNNMKKSVKNEAGLVGYYSFDDGTASDVSTQNNTGAVKGNAEVKEDNTVLSAIIGPDYSYGLGFEVYEPCDTFMPEIEEPTPKNLFGGIVSRVTRCLGKNLTEVVIEPCAASGQSSTAQIYSKNPDGTDNLENTMTGQIKVNIIDGYQVIPNVGDLILGKAVDDGSYYCTALEGGVILSSAPHVGTIASPISPQPDTAGVCPLPDSKKGGGGGSWLEDVLNWDW